MLVGDAIIVARQAVPDMPATLPPPATLTAAANSAASTLPAGAYNLVCTFIGNWGETLPSPETSVTTSGGNLTIQVTVPAGLPVGAIKLRVYLTLVAGASGSEQQFVEFTSSTGPYNISAPPINAGVPPTRNTCWLPDNDGGFIGASAIFGWLNDGLQMISQETAGLLDYFALPSVIQQPLYVVPSQWTEWTSVWYDGYWMMGGDRGMFFRRNTITSQILSSATLSVRDNRNILEVYPQPARTAQATTLGANMLPTDNTATLTSNPGFVLPFGFADIDNGTTNYEIVAYATINNVPALTGLIRGLGGTTAVAHSSSAAVRECNIAISGKRIFTTTYVSGQSAVTLPVPAGWNNLLFHYLTGRAKIIEHDTQAWSQFMTEMRAEIKLWANSNRGVQKRRQVGGNAYPAVLYPDIAGGLILP